jgi:hypothetical protein
MPLALVLLALSGGCATRLTQSEIKFLETRELSLPYSEAYQAAANGLFSLGYSIDHSDKESGVLSSKITKKKTVLSVTFLLVLPLPTLSEGTNDEAVTFMLTEVDPKSTRLRMKIVRNGKAVIDRKLMTEIWQRIEREGMLDMRPVSQATNRGSAPPGDVSGAD